MLPSALSRSDFISLGACWAFPFQPVLLSVRRRTLRLGLSQSFAPAAPAVSGRLRPACSTNCCDLPDPIQMVSFCCEKLPALLRRSGANLFHCRSPFYLCLEHVDDLGAYSIPSGDRPSHPIWLQHLLADFPQADFRPASLNVCSEA